MLTQGERGATPFFAFVAAGALKVRLQSRRPGGLLFLLEE